MIVPARGPSHSASHPGTFELLLAYATLPLSSPGAAIEWGQKLSDALGDNTLSLEAEEAALANQVRVRLLRPDARRRPLKRLLELERLPGFDRVDPEEVKTFKSILESHVVNWKKQHAALFKESKLAILGALEADSVRRLRAGLRQYLAVLAPINTAEDIESLIRITDDLNDESHTIPAACKKKIEEIFARVPQQIVLGSMSVPQIEQVMVFHANRCGRFRGAPEILKWLATHHYSNSVKTALRRYAAAKPMTSSTSWAQVVQRSSPGHPYSKISALCCTPDSSKALELVAEDITPRSRACFQLLLCLRRWGPSAASRPMIPGNAMFSSGITFAPLQTHPIIYSSQHT